jgi:hypothetical protein
MKRFRRIASFLVAEEGAVTVDWVVLTAAVVGLGVAALGAVKSGMQNITDRINSQLSSQAIDTTLN